MHRVLIAVDGSKPAERAVRHVIGTAAAGMKQQVLLLNVQLEWAPARSKEEKDEGRRLHAEAADQATRRARALLEAAGLPYESAMRVGDEAGEIAALARARKCSQIVMGMRGRGAIARVVLGSVSLKTLRLAEVPVTIVK
ncbi:MAG TPA: universal stress protein [Burkholderiales bacterium]|nr:universal stress protein [Burkholderiales bacterium]